MILIADSRIFCLGLSVLSIDIMDISGESQFNIMHDMERVRLHSDGRVVDQGGAKGKQNPIRTHIELFLNLMAR